ncbi:MAG TPA: hypothetical protein VIK30_00045 [Polyangia bacterium]
MKIRPPSHLTTLTIGLLLPLAIGGCGARATGSDAGSEPSGSGGANGSGGASSTGGGSGGSTTASGGTTGGGGDATGRGGVTGTGGTIATGGAGGASSGDTGAGGAGSGDTGAGGAAGTAGTSSGGASGGAGVGGNAPTQTRIVDNFEQLGVDVQAPRFAWVVNDNARAETQTAYQIILATDEAAITANQGTL